MRDSGRLHPIIWLVFKKHFKISGTQPWDDPEIANSSTVLAVFQSFTKISAMMVGELEANDILDRKAWVANLLLIVFEIITVILLMNLMISLAVGDVNDLRQEADNLLLRIKLNFCIEALHLSEQVSLLDSIPFINVLHRATTNNVLVIHKNSNRVYSTYFKALRARFFTETNALNEEKQEVFELVMNASGLRVRRDYFSTRSNCKFLIKFENRRRLKKFSLPNSFLLISLSFFKSLGKIQYFLKNLTNFVPQKCFHLKLP